MKIRSGFVSNSSSSSFIISDKENMEQVVKLINNNASYFADYYILNDILYTSFIGDYSDFYFEISRLSDGQIEGGHSGPYSEEDFIEFEGDRGVTSVYIPREACKNVVEAENQIKDKLYKFIKGWIEIYNIKDEESLYQYFGIEASNELIDLVINIIETVGYNKS